MASELTPPNNDPGNPSQDPTALPQQGPSANSTFARRRRPGRTSKPIDAGKIPDQVDKAGKRISQAGQVGKQAGNTMRAGGTAARGAGQTARGAGKTVDGAGKAISGAGKGLSSAGSAIQGAGPVGAVVGGAMRGAGAAVDGAGKVASGAGKAVDKSGKAVNKAGKSTQQAGKQLHTSSKNVQKTGKNISQASRGLPSGGSPRRDPLSPGKAGGPSGGPLRGPRGTKSEQAPKNSTRSQAQQKVVGAAAKVAGPEAQAALKGAEKVKQIVRTKSGKRLLGLTVGGWLLWQLMMMMLVVGTAVAVAGTIGHAIDGLVGDAASVGDFIDHIPGGISGYLKKHFGAQVRATLDCSNLPPAQRQPGKNCLNGLLNYGEGSSPIPPSAEWLVPIWEQAATKYHIPWQLLAAVNATRTDFGDSDCPDSNHNIGTGFYRFPTSAWQTYRVEAGGAKTQQQGTCWTSDSPAKVDKNSNIGGDGKANDGANIYDAVDSTFSEAHMLSTYIAGEQPIALSAAQSAAAKTAAQAPTDTNWNYTGGDSNQCTPDDSDGQVYFVPATTGDNGSTGVAGSGATLGYNKNLNIPRSLVKEAAHYRSNTMPWTPRRLQTGPYPFSPDDGQGPFPTMPESVVRQMLVAAWEAFGKSSATAQIYASDNLDQVTRESTFKPYILQGYLGDGNDQTPAGGLFQYIPSTWNTWHVSGYNDRFNPLDNILATVNAQVNSGMGYILNGASGWGPGDGSNPYATGGTSTAATTSGNSSSDDGSYTSVSATPDGGYTPATWSAALLSSLNIPETDDNMQALVGWTKAEGGAGPQWNVAKNTAAYNPLNATLTESGSHAVNDDNVQAYTSWSEGIEANASELQQANFRDIYQALQSGSANEIGQAILQDKWGTGPDVLTTISQAPSDLGSTAVSGDGSGGGPYNGPAQTDPISRAVADQTSIQNNSDNASACYVAVVHDWYQAIVNNPPDSTFVGDSGPVRDRIIENAVSKLGVGENPPGSNCTQWSPCGQPWCADFASWAWEQANVPGFPAWADHFASVDEFMDWGIAHHTWHPIGDGYKPQVGDGIDYGNGEHIAMVYQVLPNGEIKTIAGNTGTNNVAFAGPALPADWESLGPGPIAGYISPVNDSDTHFATPTVNVPTTPATSSGTTPEAGGYT